MLLKSIHRGCYGSPLFFCISSWHISGLRSPSTCWPLLLVRIRPLCTYPLWRGAKHLPPATSTTWLERRAWCWGLHRGFPKRSPSKIASISLRILSSAANLVSTWRRPLAYTVRKTRPCAAVIGGIVSRRLLLLGRTQAPIFYCVGVWWCRARSASTDNIPTRVV